jgi:hypothetical protein
MKIRGIRSVMAFVADPAAAARSGVPHRGPLGIPGGRRICQLRDPFGTIWGLDGLDADL